MIATPPAQFPGRGEPPRSALHGLASSPGPARRRSWPPLRRCPATLAVTGVLTVVFLVQWAVGAFGLDPLPMLAMGANSTALVKAGEWQRLVTANLLHGNLLHFSLNVLALLYIGGILELLVGVRRYIALLLVSCLGGSVASAFLTDALIAVGVSTGLLGLIAANLVFTLRFAADRRRAARSLAFLVAVVIAVSLPFEWLLARLLYIRVDHFGHLGGFVAGLIFTVATMREASVRELRRNRRDPIALVVAVGLSLLFLGTAARTGVTYATEGLAPTAEAFLARIEMPEDDDEALVFKFFYNNAAWILATRAETTRRQLETALSAMRWVEDDEPSRTVPESDTLATVLYRLGDHDAAVRRERQVLELSQQPEVAEHYGFGQDDVAFFASQLGRFEWARYREAGPVSTSASGLPEAFLVAPSRERCDAPGAPAPAPVSTLRRGFLLSKGGWGEAVEIHVVLVRGEAPVGFFKALAGFAAPVWLEYGELGEEFLGCDVRAVVTLAEAKEVSAVEGVRWQFWPTAADAAELP